MNPRSNWRDAAYEFDLPPLDDQKRIADLLWAVERHWVNVTARRESSALLLDAAL